MKLIEKKAHTLYVYANKIHVSAVKQKGLSLIVSNITTKTNARTRTHMQAHIHRSNEKT